MSINELREAFVTGDVTNGLSDGNEVPFRNAWPAFRGWR